MNRWSFERGLLYCIALFMISAESIFPNTLSHCLKVYEQPSPVPLVTVGAGNWAPDSRFSTTLLQLEYRWGCYFWHLVRPEIGVITPGFRALYLYGGISLDLYITKHLLFSPSFAPGLYLQGNGKKLGFPIEFRSALELAYEFNNRARAGVQFYHLSNAHLGRKNPGVNAIALFVGIPL